MDYGQLYTKEDFHFEVEFIMSDGVTSYILLKLFN